MRNLKRRVLVVGLVVALGVGLWRAFVWWSEADEATAGHAATALSAASPAPVAPEPQYLSSADLESDGRNSEETELWEQTVHPGTYPDHSRTALGASSPEEAPRAIYLRADAPPDGILSSPVRGLDTGAPRALVLWRMDGERRVRVADGWSAADGSLHFPDVLVPDSSVQLMLTAAEEGPAGLDRSAPDEVQLGGLRAPQVRTTRDVHGKPGLRVTASHSLGAVVVADAGGLEIARVELSRVPFPGRRLLDVPLAEGAAGTFLVAQELPDGSRSAWQLIDVPAEAP